MSDLILALSIEGCLIAAVLGACGILLLLSALFCTLHHLIQKRRLPRD